MTDLISEIEITTVHVIAKFVPTIRLSTLVNSSFVVTTNEATPQTIADPFETIVLAEDYNSISKILTLNWNADVLDVSTDYILTFTGLVNAAGEEIADVEVTFTTGASVTPTDDEIPPAATPTSVVDYSLISDIFITPVVLSSPTAEFRILDTDPANNEYYIEPDYENGRVTIKFSVRPDLESLTTPYIKVQRKIIQRAPSRWETLTAQISLDSERPWVYVDFPSVDHYPEAATPATTTVYMEPDYTYYETNYKYRILISSELYT